MAYNPYDLTQHPPRSPRCRLGGMVILPRLLDKARATINNMQGEYTYGCSLDQYVLTFLESMKKTCSQKSPKASATETFLRGLWQMLNTSVQGKRLLRLVLTTTNAPVARPKNVNACRNTSPRRQLAQSGKIFLLGLMF